MIGGSVHMLVHVYMQLCYLQVVYILIWTYNHKILFFSSTSSALIPQTPNSQAEDLQCLCKLIW